MFRRTQASRGFDPRYLQIVDLEMWIHLLEQGRFAYIPEPLSAFRVHPRQQSEINRRQGVNIEEHSRLLRDQLAKPRVREKITPQFLFNRIHHCKKNCNDEAAGLIAEMMLQLGVGWYAAYWLKRRLIRPFKELTR